MTVPLWKVTRRVLGYSITTIDGGNFMSYKNDVGFGGVVEVQRLMRSPLAYSM